MTSRNRSVVEDVREYYDQNTARFVRFGQGKDSGSIHRAIRPEADAPDRDPLRTLDRLVLAELRSLQGRFSQPLHVLDLGCGVGASLVYLATALPITATGVTLSGVQAAQARERMEAHELDERVEILEASYLELPATLPPAALAFSLEAFVHSPEPGAYFRASAEHVAPGGLLVVCDDFLAPRAAGSLGPRDRQRLADVRTGWHASSLVTVAEADELATRAGFRLEKNLDLSRRVELGRPRDRGIALFVALARPFAPQSQWFKSLLGGAALQQALASGLIEFRCLVWQKQLAP
jgi:predicted O-methyltransferase YrrM